MEKVKQLPVEGMVRLSDLIGGPTRIIPFSRATIYRMIEQGTFPRPKRFGNCVAWPVQAIRAWIDSVSNSE
jgi:hypothetical protein